MRKCLATHPNQANLTLVEVPSGHRDQWRDPKNPYRVHPTIKLERIPTLIKWTASGPGARLVEEEVADEAKVKALVA